MRTLVEQTETTARIWIEAARRELGLEVELAVLMGGRDADKRGIPGWIVHPEKPTILVGTQDLLVSAALMRAYGANRYRWPVDFALLHNDALWVLDEVQLAGAALSTSAQLEAFRATFGTARPSCTLWMSATLDRSWLRTVDFTPEDLGRKHDNDLSDEDIARARHLWVARKRLTQLELSAGDLGKKDGLKAYAAALAGHALQHSVPGTNTIIFLNTVPRAQAVFAALEDRLGDPDRLLLIHSRFRGSDRVTLSKRLLDKPPPSGRVVVATQALEAGIDVTSAVMISEIAPWSSMVQRFGRCNRYGEQGEACASVFWVDLPIEQAQPYETDDLTAARHILESLIACGPADLADIRPSTPARTQVIRRRDLLDLYDTDPDLSGFDVDVSVYVRDTDDTDVRLFWRPIADSEDRPGEDAPEPFRDELCTAPIGRARELVKRVSGHAWRWDGLARRWGTIRDDDVFPGSVLWIDAALGGYDVTRGFDPSSKSAVEGVKPPPITTGLDALGENLESFTSKARVSLARHSEHVYAEMAALADVLHLAKDERTFLLEGALWHDWGKAHEAFVALTCSALTDGVEPPLAKWPRGPKGAPRPQGTRKYFRHELASALAFLALHDWSEAASLPAYLIAAHHGKVRMRLRALPEENGPKDGRLFARGVYDGDKLPATKLGQFQVPETRLDLDVMQIGDSERCGPSWSARTQRLLREHGPFKLAWLEALLRIADWRASAEEDGLTNDDL
jgi:CRISPR-associated endonuclease/helicase Cas3